MSGLKSVIDDWCNHSIMPTIVLITDHFSNSAEMSKFRGKRHILRLSSKFHGPQKTVGPTDFFSVTTYQSQYVAASFNVDADQLLKPSRHIAYLICRPRHDHLWATVDWPPLEVCSWVGLLDVLTDLAVHLRISVISYVQHNTSWDTPTQHMVHVVMHVAWHM